MSARPRYWFPVKRYGWGWGLPTAWQGWAVLVGFAGLLLAGSLVVLPAQGVEIFLAYSVLLCALLLAVCWLKGELPSWRWGGH